MMASCKTLCIPKKKNTPLPRSVNCKGRERVSSALRGAPRPFSAHITSLLKCKPSARRRFRLCDIGMVINELSRVELLVNPRSWKSLGWLRHDFTYYYISDHYRRTNDQWPCAIYYLLLTPALNSCVHCVSSPSRNVETTIGAPALEFNYSTKSYLLPVESPATHLCFVLMACRTTPYTLKVSWTLRCGHKTRPYSDVGAVGAARWPSSDENANQIIMKFYQYTIFHKYLWI